MNTWSAFFLGFANYNYVLENPVQTLLFFRNSGKVSLWDDGSKLCPLLNERRSLANMHIWVFRIGDIPLYM